MSNKKKGRNSELITLRNKALINRYFELRYIDKRRDSDIIDKLMFEEFFISEQRISVILLENNDLLNELVKKRNAEIVEKTYRNKPIADGGIVCPKCKAKLELQLGFKSKL